MLKLFMPLAEYQENQFKLYASDFIEELEKETAEMYRQLRVLALNFHKTIGYENQEPFTVMTKKSRELADKSEFYKEKQKQIENKVKQYRVKLQHSIDVAYDSKNVGIDLDLFNEENIRILWSSGLLHDIGRFLQLRQTGTFKDAESFSGDRFGKISDHGQLGKKILLEDDWIKVFFPFTRKYDDFISTVVENHFESHLNDYKISPNYKPFKDYGLHEMVTDKQRGLLTAAELYKRLASFYVKIIQDVDRLDILRQIERGDFNPTLSNEKKDNVNSVVYDLFYNGCYIDMSNLRKKGLWTCNAGQLVRWSFLYQLSLVSTVQNIKNLQLIEKIWYKNPIDDLKPGYDFTLALMDALIVTSPDGIYTDKASALSLVKKL